MAGINWRKSLTGLGLATALSWAASPAQAVIVFEGVGLGNPAAYTQQESGVPVWNNVGWLGTGVADSDAPTGIYLGGGWVLGPRHSGAGFGITLFTNNPTGGTRFNRDMSQPVRNLTNPNQPGDPDLALWKVQMTPELAALPAVTLATHSPAVGAAGKMIGTGKGRGAAVHQNPLNDASPVIGYQWAAGRQKAWANNQVSMETELTPVHPFGANDPTVFTTELFQTTFNNISGDGQLTAKDSGSGFFIRNNATGQYELAGMGLYISGTTGTATRNDVAYWADISAYRAEIISIMPEPSSALLLLFSAPMLLRRRGK